MEKLIIFALFVGFSIFSSLMKSAKEKREREKALARRRAAGLGEDGPLQKPKKSVQSQIESFLNEVGNGGAAPKQQKKSRQQQEQEAAKKRKQQAVRRRKREIAERKREIAERKRQHQQSSKQQKAAAHQKKRVSPEVPQPHETIAQSVESHLGKRNTEMPPSTRSTVRRAASAEIFSMLQDSEGVRNAIIVNEILNRPKSLRD